MNGSQSALSVVRESILSLAASRALLLEPAGRRARLKPANQKGGGRPLANVLLLLAGILLFRPSPIRSEQPAAAKKTAAPTKKILGRALDVDGRPVAGATVCLTREEDSEVEPFEPTVIAQTQSRADGRFELAPLDSELKKPVEYPPSAFEIWIWKPGLALAHSVFLGEPSERPFSICLENESPVAIRLHKPDGSPCGGATVTPIFVWLRSGRWEMIPKPVQDRLKVRSASDGRVDVPGLDGQFGTVRIETPEFGAQTLSLPAQEPSPVAVTLRETKVLEGRLVLPKGEKGDLSRLKLVINESSREKNSESKTKTSKLAGNDPGNWYDHFVVRPDREGRFTIGKFPKAPHGTFEFHVSGSNDLAWANDRGSASSSFDVPQGMPLKIEIPLRKGVRLTRIVRDSRTRQPLAGISVIMISSKGSFFEETTDKNGRFRVCLCPGDTYHLHCDLPDGYLHPRAGCEDDILVPTGVDQCELKPMELVQGCTVQGEVYDASGQPISGIRVRATWRAGEPETAKVRNPDVSRWATTDAAGRFRFEAVEAGTNVMLVAVRTGVALADPVQIVAGDDKPLRLQEKTREVVALGGRVVGLDRKPISGAQVVVDVEHSPDPSGLFRTTVDSDGSFRTPANFPAQLKYRLTVRSILQDIASSDWMCPAASGNRFPDLVVERSKLGLESRLFGGEIVARVNGRPILASEIFERAYPEPLPPNGLSLLVASRGMEFGRVTEQEFRTLQETAIRRYVRDYVRTRVLSQALEAKMEEEQKKKTEEAIDKMFDEYVERLKKDMKVAARHEVDQQLHQQGTSLASLKVEFRYRLLADEYVRRAGNEDSAIDPQHLLAYYQAHRDSYAVREKVSWQLLEIKFDNPSLSAGRQVNQFDNAIESETHGDDEVERWRKARQVGVDSDPWSPHRTRHADDESDKTGTSCNKNRPEVDVVDYAAHLLPRLDPRKARSMMDEALAQLRKGEPFEAVVKKLSNGPNADRGGWQSRISPDSSANKETAAALRQLAEGETSGVIETGHSFRIVRVACRTPPGWKAFEEVEESIRQVIQRELQRKALEVLYSQVSIESPYITDVASLLQPPPPVSCTKEDDAFAP